MFLALWLAQAGGDLPSAWGIVQTGGIAGVLFLGLYLVLSGRIPTKQQVHDKETQIADLKAEVLYWRQLALRGTAFAEDHVKTTDEEVVLRLQGIENILKGKGIGTS